MAATETARLIASLELKDLFTKQVDNATKSLGKLDKSIDSTQGRAYKAGTQIGTGIKRGVAIGIGAFSLLAANVALGVKSLESVEKVTTQTNAVLKSTKDASGQTAQGIRDMSNAFESLNATMDDTTIQSGANVLLTFTNIRTKAFKPALQAALDLSTAMGQDLQSSVVQIGKALNDPIKGITSLTRVGVTFSKQQKDQIKDLIKHNDLYGAQKVILGELNREFAGSFLGQGQTTAGKFAKVRDAVDDLQRALATALLPALGKIADAVSKTLADPKVIANVQRLGQDIAGLFSDQNLATAANAVQGFIKTVVAAAPILEASAKATLGFVQAAVGVFNTLPDPLKALIAGGFALNKITGGLVTNIGGALIDLVGKSRGATPANPVFVADVTGGLGGAVGAAGAAGGLGVAAAVASLAAVAGVELAGAEVLRRIINPNSSGNPLQTRTAELDRAHLLGQNAPVQNVRVVNDILGRQQPPSTLLDRGGREKGFSELAGKFEDDRVSLKQLLGTITGQFRSALGILEHSNDPKKITSAIRDLETVMVANGHGSVQQTKETIHALETQLRKTHDPTLQAALKTALHDLKEKIPGREYAQRQIDRANKIIGSTRSVEDKIRGLQAIENDLKNHKLPGQTRALQEKIDALKASQARSANATTQAVKDKDLSVTVNASTPPVYLNGVKVTDAIRRASQAYRMS